MGINEIEGEYIGYVIQAGVGGEVDVWVGADGAYTTNKSKSNWDKHTKKRAGAPSKASKKPGWTDRSNKRKP